MRFGFNQCFLKNSLGAYGAEYEKKMDFEQKCFAETQALNEALFDMLAKQDDADTVLVAGDLTFWGEKECNLAVAQLLRIFRRLRPFIKTLKGSQGEKLDFYETMKHTVGNYGIDDYNAVLKLK